MEALQAHIKQVNDKLQILLAKFAQLQIEYERQQKLLTTLQANDAVQKDLIAEMVQKQLILKAALDVMDDAEKKVLDKKLNGYIKNIDKCISLLSHKNNE